jgi:hypothetical protein
VQPGQPAHCATWRSRTIVLNSAAFAPALLCPSPSFYRPCRPLRIFRSSLPERPELWQLGICCGVRLKMAILKPHGAARRVAGLRIGAGRRGKPPGSRQNRPQRRLERLGARPWPGRRQNTSRPKAPALPPWQTPEACRPERQRTHGEGTNGRSPASPNHRRRRSRCQDCAANNRLQPSVKR